MKKIIYLIVSLFICTHVHAETVVDLYGANDKVSDLILKKYGAKIASIEGYLTNEVKKHPDNLEDIKTKKMVETRFALIKKIKKEFGFLYIDFCTIVYPGGDDIDYTTIDVVSNKDPDRLRFVGPQKNYKVVEVNEKNRKNVIDDMLIYSHLSNPIMFSGKLGKNIPCPVYHCFAGFEDKVLKPYLMVFNTGVIKDKKLILDTMSNKTINPERRIAAIFLLGHLQSPDEIISLLLPYVYDKDDGVRNAAMRVIGETASKAKITSLDIAPFLDALNSPYTTDRNKALNILIKLANSDRIRRLIIKQGGDNLVAILRLKQPNNHGMAYILLKEISGKDFSETNISAWKAWLSKAKTQYV